MTPDSSDHAERVWQQAWTDQYELWSELGDRIRKLTEGRSDAYGAALTSYLIEHLAEKRRMFLRLPESDGKPGGGAGDD